MKDYISNNLFGFVSVLRATSFRFFVIKTKEKKVSINFSLIFLRHWSYYCINVYIIVSNSYCVPARTGSFINCIRATEKKHFEKSNKKTNKWMKLIWDLSDPFIVTMCRRKTHGTKLVSPNIYVRILKLMVLLQNDESKEKRKLRVHLP